MENSAPIVPEAPIKLWLPGLGETDLRIRRVVKAVRDYDADLKLARHEITGDWVVVNREDGFPIFGFGRELPPVDEVSRRLEKHDIKRHRKKILDQLEREAQRKKKESEYRISEAEEAAADAMSWFYSKHGKKRSVRVVVPRGIEGR